MKIKTEKPISQLRPLEVQCQHPNCEEGFHYYTGPTKRAAKKGWSGGCKDCGDKSIDWERIRKRDLNDLQYTFDSLKKELLRNVCWVNTLEEGVIPFARKRGKNAILQHAKDIITKRIAKIPVGRFDYRCTPTKGKEIVHYAQHATATCCRRCLEHWHGIPQTIVLNESQIDYCVGLVEKYLNDRMPDLKDEPENSHD
ncbi:MAG: DUF4186 family protein [Bacteroidetes bacterium]|nr:DUF4186 family protein [Bacteroidota bacterium]